MSVSVDCKNILQASLRDRRPFHLRPYVLPYSIVYVLVACIHGILRLQGIWGNVPDIALIVGLCLPAFIGNILVWLSTEWSVRFKCWATTYQAKDPFTAHFIYIHSKDGKKGSGLFPLHQETRAKTEFSNTDYVPEANVFRMRNSGKEMNAVHMCWFTYQNQKYLYVVDSQRPDDLSKEKIRFIRLRCPTHHPLSFYTHSITGYPSQAAVQYATEMYDGNKITVPLPRFLELLREHAVAPFFVFQVFCVLLWCLDEYWYYSLFTLGMLIMFEATVVQQRLQHLREIRSMRTPPYQLYVHRTNQWTKISSEELLPGDILSIPDPLYVQATAAAGKATQPRARSNSTTQTSTSSSPSSSETVPTLPIPCDALLLRGECIVNESTLTGESVPQQKFSLMDGGVSVSMTDELDMKKIHGMHLLYAGTRLLQVTGRGSRRVESWEEDAHKTNRMNVPKSMDHISLPPDRGCVAYVLRTGFHTSHGKLLGMVLRHVEHVTINNWETLLFILFLLFFAFLSCMYVLWCEWSVPPMEKTTTLLDILNATASTNATETPTSLFSHILASTTSPLIRHRLKLVVECLLIMTTVIPPELPMELSMAVNHSLTSLSRRFGIFCTEPFRIPFAGLINMCLFDKTGTLTEDEMLVQGVVLLNPRNEHGGKPVDPVLALSNSPLWTQIVLAGCHSLSVFESTETESREDPTRKGQLVGDPMERVVVSTLGWKAIDEEKGQSEVTDTFVNSQWCSPDNANKVIVLRRFPFHSALKRMSTICGVESRQLSSTKKGERQVVALIKGAPDTLEEYFQLTGTDQSINVSTYRETCDHYAREGYRVIALGYRFLNLEKTHVDKVTREDVEKPASFVFAGMLLLECPLQPDAKSTLNELMRNGYPVVIVTGDHPQTACHVARTVGIMGETPLVHVYNLDADASHEPTEKSIIEGLFCVTGTWLRRHEFILGVNTDPMSDMGELSKSMPCACGLCKAHVSVASFLSRIVVFARVTPDQKQQIVEMYKLRGYMTLMCGDGMNDVGALRHAYVGVALVYRDGPDPIVRRTNPGIHQILQTAAMTAREAQHQGMTPSETRAYTKRRIEEMRSASMQEMNMEDDSSIILKSIQSGDVSMAAPFSVRICRNPGERADQASRNSLNSSSAGRGPLGRLLQPPAVATGLSSVLTILQHGQSVWSTTLQMYKILALHCLISAYSMSVLHLHHVRVSDTQATISGMLIAFCFLFLSRSGQDQSPTDLQDVHTKNRESLRSSSSSQTQEVNRSSSPPKPRLSPFRPRHRILNGYTLGTVFGQWLIHVVCWVLVATAALYVSDPHAAQSPKMILATDSIQSHPSSWAWESHVQWIHGCIDAFVHSPMFSLECVSVGSIENSTSEATTTKSMNSGSTLFKPTLLNTVVYLVSLTMNVSTFLVNYEGRPFRERLRQNRGLFYALAGVYIFAVACVWEWIPEWNQMIELIPFGSTQMKVFVTTIMFLDTFAAWLWDRTMALLFGRYERVNKGGMQK